MPTNPSTTPTLVRFYDPAIQAPDPSGRTVSSILALPDTDLEHRHDYIQLLFPLPEPSPYHPTAPVIDRATFAAFRSRPDLRSRLLTSLTRMLHFYGLDLPARSQRPPARDDDDDDDPSPEIVRGANFARASRNWVRRFDHNHLRITRIVRCLRVLGLEGHAAALFRALGSVYDGGRAGIGAKSMMFWTRAAERPLHLAPEDERDEGRGKDFLYEYEASRQAGANGDGDGGDGAREGNGQGGEGAGGRMEQLDAGWDTALGMARHHLSSSGAPMAVVPLRTARFLHSPSRWLASSGFLEALGIVFTAKEHPRS